MEKTNIEMANQAYLESLIEEFKNWCDYEDITDSEGDPATVDVESVISFLESKKLSYVEEDEIPWNTNMYIGEPEDPEETFVPLEEDDLYYDPIAA